MKLISTEQDVFLLMSLNRLLPSHQNLQTASKLSFEYRYIDLSDKIHMRKRCIFFELHLPTFLILPSCNNLVQHIILPRKNYAKVRAQCSPVISPINSSQRNACAARWCCSGTQCPLFLGLFLFLSFHSSGSHTFLTKRLYQGFKTFALVYNFYQLMLIFHRILITLGISFILITLKKLLENSTKFINICI